MAEAFLKAAAKHRNDFFIHSAGTSAINGENPTPEAIQAMEEREIDISSYVTTPVSKALVESADLILVMSQRHKSILSKKFSGHEDKIFLYKEYAGTINESRDVADPIGQPMSVYRRVCDEIERASEKIIEKLKSIG